VPHDSFYSIKAQAVGILLGILRKGEWETFCRQQKGRVKNVI
jgi:hypothetical protein